MKEKRGKKGFFTGIRAKINGMLALLMAAIVLTLVLTLYFSFRQTTTDLILDAVTTTIEINTDMVATLMERIRTATELVYPSGRVEQSKMPPIGAMIVNFQPSLDYSNFNEQVKNYEEGKRLFQDYFRTCFGEEGIDYVSQLYVEEKYPLASYLSKIHTLDLRDSGIFSNRKVKEESWYEKTHKEDGGIFWFTRKEQPDLLYVSRLLKVNYYSDGKIREENLGVLVLQLDISWISSRLQQEHMTKNTEIFLLDEAGNAMYVSNGTPQAFSGKELFSLQEGFQECTFGGMLYLTQKKSLAMGLKMVTLVPMEEVQFLGIDAFRIILYVAVIVLVFALMISMLVSGKIVAPIERLAGHMRKGSLKPIAEYSHKDEIGILYHSFNGLMQELKQAEAEVEEAFLKEKEANLRALQAQINPHFIYNTLNSVSCMALLRGENEISQILGSLAKVIRYNLKEPDAMVPLEKEMENIYSWSKIQECCYAQSIQFSYDIQVPADHIRIPKLIIQPLIENAVIHGANFAGEDARICVHVLMKEEMLEILVWDNGTGVDVEKINALLTDGKKEQNSDSLGVRNVYDRIYLHYGKEGHMYFEQDKEGHTQVKILIPARLTQDVKIEDTYIDLEKE